MKAQDPKKFFDYAGFSFRDALHPQDLAPHIDAWNKDLRGYIEQTRRSIAQSLGVPHQHIFLTTGTTQSFKHLLLNRTLFPEQRRVVCSDLAYPKLFNALQARCEHITILPISSHEDPNDIVDTILQQIDEEVVALVLDLVDNRRGLALPIAQLYPRLKARFPQCQLFLDASQGYGQLPQLKESSHLYDFLLADLKKWCNLKSYTGTGFICATSPLQLEQVSLTMDCQFSVDPSLLKHSVGRADAGGADVWSWCLAHEYIERTFSTLTSQNQQRARFFLEQILQREQTIHTWPRQPSASMTGMVSIVEPYSVLAQVHQTLQEEGFRCSLIPTNLPPYPHAIREGAACLRFSFHDQKTHEADVEVLLDHFLYAFQRASRSHAAPSNQDEAGASWTAHPKHDNLRGHS
ncbi:MAG: hypothetical protein CL920_24975 [Deltaproteobacteria bacterium]|nr:hypothetical protein [Deltaproteobacteria bacterium]MBU51958.1 hypothetical protein [Deltaproteobacteria bacterium]|tara:strand:+ start:4399 stop:5616 length:1218 start_codon:yes stop_codon:yes gene_type:complete